MPPEPEHPMEPALRTYAGRRRADAPAPALHPANRRQLQDEVTRLRQAQGPAPRRAWLTLAWPRLAFAAAACAVLTLLLLNLRSLQPQPAPAQTSARLEPREASPPPAAQTLQTPAPAVPAPAPPAPVAPVVAAPAMAPTVAAAAPAPPVTAPVTPAVTADAPPAAIAPRLLTQGAPGLTPRMAAARPPERRRYQRADSPAGEGALLQSFDVEQTGTQIRLVDADGSIYLGSLSLTNALVFVVSGVQKDSGRTVTVEGSFLAETPVAAEDTPAAPAARSARSAPRVAASPGASAGRALQLRIRPEGGAESRGLARPVVR